MAPVFLFSSKALLSKTIIHNSYPPGLRRCILSRRMAFLSLCTLRWVYTAHLWCLAGFYFFLPDLGFLVTFRGLFHPLSDVGVLLYPGGISANGSEMWGIFRQYCMQKSHHRHILRSLGDTRSMAALCFPATQGPWDRDGLSRDTMWFLKHLRADAACAWHSSTGDPETSLTPDVHWKVTAWSQWSLWDCACSVFLKGKQEGRCSLVTRTLPGL